MCSFQSVAHWLKDVPDFIQDLWRLVHALSGAEPLMERSISELMWGYDDPYLELAQQILGEDRVPSTKFGLFLGVRFILDITIWKCLLWGIQTFILLHCIARFLPTLVFVWLLTLCAQIFTTCKDVVKDKHQQTSTDAQH